MFTIMFFGTHEYDHYYFDVLAQDPAYGCRIRYLAANLDADTAPLAQGGDAACVFVNADCSARGREFGCCFCAARGTTMWTCPPPSILA